MTKEEKYSLVEGLTEKLKGTNYFYVADASGMSVAQVNRFRKACFEKGIEYIVVKNTLIAKALENLEIDFSEFSEEVLKGFSGLMLSPEAGNIPAKLLKEFRKGQKKGSEKPQLKGASIDGAFFYGDNQLEALTQVKSKAELVGDIITLLQSPAKNVISGLQASGGQKIAALLKTLSERDAA